MHGSVVLGTDYFFNQTDSEVSKVGVTWAIVITISFACCAVYFAQDPGMGRGLVNGPRLIRLYSKCEAKCKNSSDRL